MREVLRGLTRRGTSLLCASAGLLLASLLIGEKDLLRPAALIGLVPLASVLLLWRTRYRMTVTRTINPVRVGVGQKTSVTLYLQNDSVLPTGTIMAEDQLPYALGVRPRLVVEKLGPKTTRSIAYTVQATQRGLYEVGPLTVRTSDPFGVVEVGRHNPVCDRVIVLPRVTPLPPVTLPGEYAGSGANRARAVAVHGEDDAATREYRYGDDLRRVHWRSTARFGELMVRREEQPWDSRATVVMDARAGAHRGDGPTSSFEWAVSATASINKRLQESGYKLRLVTETADVEPDHVGDSATMDYLASVRSIRHGDVQRLVTQIQQRDHGGMIVAVLGSLSQKDAAQLAALNRAGATCIALLMDTTTWLSLKARARTDAEQAHRDSATALLRAGWRVVSIRHGDDLASRWRELGAGAVTNGTPSASFSFGSLHGTTS